MNRTERNQLAESLRHYVSGQISNFEFMDRTDKLLGSRDKAVTKIMSSFWLAYDDIKEHKNDGKHKLTKDGEDSVNRFILFLKSDNDFEWEDFRFEDIPFLRPLIYLISFGKLPKKWDDKIIEKGDFELWPFFRKSDFQKEIDNPKYLNKKNATQQNL